MIGAQKRKKKTEKLLYEKQIYIQLLRTPSIKSIFQEKILDNISHTLRLLPKIKQVYYNNIISKLRWKSYIRSQKVYKDIVEDITNKDKNTIVAYGSGGFSSTSKGFLPGPCKKLKIQLKNKCNFIDINEYLTSQICSKCLCKLVKHKYGDNHFVQECSNTSCGYKWARDLNSARNMMIIFVGLLINNQRPFEFSKENNIKNS